jgi:hypothetical protein
MKEVRPRPPMQVLGIDRNLVPAQLAPAPALN